MIYLDNAATTKIEEEVLAAMLPFLKEEYGNASAVYELARNSKKAVFNARKQCASLIGASPSEIFFTSGGSESDNWALCGVCKPGTHLITTQIEHHAVLRTAEYLESIGVSVTYIKPDSEGFINPVKVAEAVRPETVLVSVMTANNEIGTIEPVREISEAVRKVRKDILIHTDAVQAYGHIHLEDISKYVNLLSASAHKIGGPKGCGLLFVKDGVKLSPYIRGGMQESGRRAGTENIPGIAGFGKAAEIRFAGIDANSDREKALSDRFLAKIGKLDGILVNGPVNERLPGNLSFCIEGIEGESALIMLDREGICASSGSACASGAREPTHVLKAIGRSAEQSKGSLRFTFSHHNTEEEIDVAADKLIMIVDKLRNRERF